MEQRGKLSKKLLNVEYLPQISLKPFKDNGFGASGLNIGALLVAH